MASTVSVKVTYELTANVYRVRLDVLSVGASDTALMAEFGEPSIELGGTITYNTDMTYVLPTKQAFLPDGFPVTQSFDGDAFSDAEDRANAWATYILTNITTAMATLRANSDDFTREVTTPI